MPPGMRLWIILVVGALVSAPAAAQEAGLRNPTASTPSVLYFHLNGMADFPITPESPPRGYDVSEGGGVAWTSACAPENPVTTLASQSLHTLYGYGSWGSVDYASGGDLAESPGRGLGYDAMLDGNQTARVVWYLETQAGALAGAGGGGQLPLFVPAIHVTVTVRSGDNISVNDEAYEMGELVASGDSGQIFLDPTGMTPGAAQSNDVDGRRVYEIPVNLALEQQLLRQDRGYNVRVDVWMDSVCPGPTSGYLMPNVVRHHSSDDHRPRLEWSVFNPVRIEYLKPDLVGDRIVLGARATTPWGPAGIDSDSVTLGGTPEAAFELVKTHQGYEAWATGHEPIHSHRADPANVEYTWVWSAAPSQGKLAFALAVSDLSGSWANATALLDLDGRTATAVTLDGLVTTSLAGGKEAPAPGIAILLAALAVVAVGLARRP